MTKTMTIDQTRNWLANQSRKQWQDIADATGINKWWFPKFVDGVIKNPGHDKIEKLTKYREKAA